MTTTPRKAAPRKAATTKATPVAAQEPESVPNIVFEFKGHKYSVPPESEWSVEIMEAVEDDKYMRALRELLGERQWSLYKLRHPKAVELEDFLNAVFEFFGNDPN